jgi:hypothetical protein
LGDNRREYGGWPGFYLLFYAQFLESEYRTNQKAPLEIEGAFSGGESGCSFVEHLMLDGHSPLLVIPPETSRQDALAHIKAVLDKAETEVVA